jgi:hypothetical protein
MNLCFLPISTADLTPIPVHRAALESSQTPPVSPEGVPARLRRGVEQQVDAIAGSANKVILGVVDQGFGVLRALLPGNPADAQVTSPENANPDQDAAPWNAARPGFGLLRRESGFSIASLAASLPVGRDRSRSFASTTGTTAEESGQMMVDVSSRPGSVRSIYGSDAESSGDENSQEDESDEEEQEGVDDRHDTRSIRSFENMMGRAARRRRPRKTRKSLSDRLASMPGLSRLSGPQAPQQAHSQQQVRTWFLCVLILGFQSVDNCRAELAFPTNVAPSSCPRSDSRLKSHRHTTIQSSNVTCTHAHRSSKSTILGSGCR